jgi:hypothetical protein
MSGGRRFFSVERIIWLLCLLLFIVLAAVHWYQQHVVKARQQESYQARNAANKLQLELAINGLKARWHADDEWENDLSTEGASLAPYAIEYEHAIVKAHPLVFYGTVEDIQTDRDQGGSVVRVKVHGRNRQVQLQLSVSATPDQIAALVKKDSFRQCVVPELSKVCIFVAHVDNVERVEGTDKQNSGSAHFVAHGILREAYASEVYGADFFR